MAFSSSRLCWMRENKIFVLCAGANGSELENENEEPYSIL